MVKQGLIEEDSNWVRFLVGLHASLSSAAIFQWILMAMTKGYGMECQNKYYNVIDVSSMKAFATFFVICSDAVRCGLAMDKSNKSRLDMGVDNLMVVCFGMLSNNMGNRKDCCHEYIILILEGFWLNLFRIWPVCAGMMADCASLDGIGRVWYNMPNVKSRGDSIVIKDEGVPMALPDRWHTKKNVDLLAPVIQRMRDSHLSKLPSVSEFEEQLMLFHMLVATKGELDQERLPRVQVPESVLHCDALGLKKMLGFARRHFLRPHVPRDRVRPTKFEFSMVFWKLLVH